MHVYLNKVEKSLGVWWTQQQRILFYNGLLYFFLQK